MRQIVEWVAERSPRGARTWLDTYDSMVARLEKNAAAFGPADENDDCEFDVRQALFKTRLATTDNAYLMAHYRMFEACLPCAWRRADVPSPRERASRCSALTPAAAGVSRTSCAPKVYASCLTAHSVPGSGHC